MNFDQHLLDLNGEIIVDGFAGGGGASCGIELGLGRTVDRALNHAAAAVAKKRRVRKHGLSRTPEYRAWQQMRLRCTNPQHAAWPNYGGRGITVCDRWKDSPEAFLADMGRKPSPAHELDRIDNDGGYHPGNCRWVLRSENDRNRRSNRRLEFGGLRLTVAEWSERFAIPRDTLTHRLNSGWSAEAALTTPVRPKAPNGCGRRAA